MGMLLVQDAQPAASFDDGSMVVVFVLAIITVGLFAFMFGIERKLSKVEKQIEE
jgi:hypothetical protein